MPPEGYKYVVYEVPLSQRASELTHNSKLDAEVEMCELARHNRSQVYVVRREFV